MSTATSRAEHHIDQAKSAAAKGFANETRRKEALELLSRAYRELKQLVSDATWAAIRDRGGKAEERDWDLSYPFDLHNVRQKHADYALEVTPSMKGEIEQIAALKVLRDEFRAMPLVPKVKKPVVILPGDKTQQRGHCQCCGRQQAVNSTVAKHGYEVKDRGNYGYFTGVCAGHTFAPMEIRRDTTDQVVGNCRSDAAALDRRAALLRSGKITPPTVTGPWNHKTREYDQIPFAEGSPWQQREAVSTAAFQAEQRARMARSFADDLEALANKVHGQPLLVVKV